MTSEELAELWVNLIRETFAYCNGLQEYALRSGRCERSFALDFKTYLDKQQSKLTKMHEKQQGESLELLLDGIGSHTKAEWYNYIFRNYKDMYDASINSINDNDDDINDNDDE